VLWNLQVLRELGLVDSTRQGRGFVWALKGVHT
jgi:predicted transcriptional regulator